MQTNYADTILNITLTGAVVRIDFGTVAPVTRPDGTQEVRSTPTQQLVMPLDGFVQAFGIQEQVIKKLLADGVLTAQPSGAAGVQASAVAPPPARAQQSAMFGDSGASPVRPSRRTLRKLVQ